MPCIMYINEVKPGLKLCCCQNIALYKFGDRPRPGFMAVAKQEIAVQVRSEFFAEAE